MDGNILCVLFGCFVQEYKHAAFILVVHRII